jgi:hypothetical protein
MKKISKIASVLLMSLLMIGTVVSTAAAAEVKPIDQAQVVQKKLPNLDRMQKITRGEQININPNQDQFYKIEIDGTTYVIEHKTTLENNPSTFGNMASPDSVQSIASVESRTFSQDLNIYSQTGILLGRIVETQTYQYNDGTYVYVPNATVSATVPIYSWPNYWSNLSISAPAFNSSNGEYTSSVQEDLNNSLISPLGVVTFQTLTAHVSVIFNAYGSAYGQAYYTN